MIFRGSDWPDRNLTAVLFLLFLPQLGRRMAELPVDPMLSKMILASEQ